jgi:hypothetical protein
MPTISVKISGMDDMEDFEYLSEEESNDFVERMIEAGILVEDGFDEDGELTYTYNFELMKVLLPEMYDEIMTGINDNLMNLYELGFVKVEYNEDLKAVFSATEEGFIFFKNQGYE